MIKPCWLLSPDESSEKIVFKSTTGLLAPNVTLHGPAVLAEGNCWTDRATSFNGNL